MSGAIPPLRNTPSWRGAQFKKSTGTTLPLALPSSTECEHKYEQDPGPPKGTFLKTQLTELSQSSSEIKISKFQTIRSASCVTSKGCVLGPVRRILSEVLRS
jgi:hypothetical protein